MLAIQGSDHEYSLCSDLFLTGAYVCTNIMFVPYIHWSIQEIASLAGHTLCPEFTCHTKRYELVKIMYAALERHASRAGYILGTILASVSPKIYVILKIVCKNKKGKQVTVCIINK